MSLLQDLNSTMDDYLRTVKLEKDRQRFTINQLADVTGVSVSTLTKQLSGERNDPKLLNSVAICKALGISIDGIFGLVPPVDAPESLRERLHAAELENAHLSEENKRLHEVNKIRTEQLSARRPVIYILLSLCAVLSCALVAYLFIDARIENAGLIQFGNLSPVAWALISLIVASIGACIWATVRFSLKSKKEP